jgi:hypothetical protein
VFWNLHARRDAQRNLSVKIAGLRAEIVMQEFPNKIAVFYIFAMMMATAVHVETLELYKVPP